MDRPARKQSICQIKYPRPNKKFEVGNPSPPPPKKNIGVLFIPQSSYKQNRQTMELLELGGT